MIEKKIYSKRNSIFQTEANKKKVMNSSQKKCHVITDRSNHNHNDDDDDNDNDEYLILNSNTKKQVTQQPPSSSHSQLVDSDVVGPCETKFYFSYILTVIIKIIISIWMVTMLKKA